MSVFAKLHVLFSSSPCCGQGLKKQGSAAVIVYTSMVNACRMVKDTMHPICRMCRMPDGWQKVFSDLYSDQVKRRDPKPNLTLCHDIMNHSFSLDPTILFWVCTSKFG